MKLPRSFDAYDKVYCVDFEYSVDASFRPEPICLVSREIRSGECMRIPLDSSSPLPYDIGQRSLFVAYFASSEVGCHYSLGWPTPTNVLDLFVEFRCETNGRELPAGNSLLGAMAHYGLDSIGVSTKEDMRELALRGGPFTDREIEALLDYCETDVDGLVALLTKMADRIDLQRALLRGQYMNAVAAMESNGIPIDSQIFARLTANWCNIKHRLVGQIDKDFQVYDGIRFKTSAFEKYLRKNNLAWPRLVSGRVSLSDETFQRMSVSHPQVEPLRELRSTLGKMQRNSLSVGEDGRNRCLISPFASKTGRNQPSNSKFIFGQSSWVRSLIQPPEGYSIAYIDWSQQEFGIAAAQSGDQKMIEAYLTGDPYLAFGKQAGKIPPDGTKLSHKAEREQFKQCTLAVQYGMGALGLARKLSLPRPYGNHLLEMHRRTYPVFWRWIEEYIARARMLRHMTTVFGWRLHVGPSTGDRTIANFPMQANGAEMLRIAIIIALDRGVKVCAPVHDAILIEAPSSEIHRAVAVAQDAMAEASRIVLQGFELRTDVDLIEYPERYRDPRGNRIWEIVTREMDSQVELPLIARG